MCSASSSALSDLTDCSGELERRPRENLLTVIKQHVALEPTHAAHRLACRFFLLGAFSVKKGTLNLMQTVPAAWTSREGFNKPSEIAGIHMPSVSLKMQRLTSTNTLIISPAPKRADINASSFCRSKAASASKHGMQATVKRHLEPTFATCRLWVDDRCQQRLCTF